MNTVFICRHTISNFKHIGIIPMIRASIFAYCILHVDNFHNAILLPCAVIDNPIKHI